MHNLKVLNFHQLIKRRFDSLIRQFIDAPLYVSTIILDHVYDRVRVKAALLREKRKSIISFARVVMQNSANMQRAGYL